MEGGGGWALFGAQALENFRCAFQRFSGREGLGAGVRGRGVFGDLAASQPQQEAREFHTDKKKKKKQPWTPPGYPSAELTHHHPKEHLSLLCPVPISLFC